MPSAAEADDDSADTDDGDDAQHANSVELERRGWRGANAGSSKSSATCSPLLAIERRVFCDRVAAAFST